ncbi:MAG: hypothetical protein LBK61_09275 [Spirochaetaceae bacterium]|jgi:hypothetical protein|nr:hypothetical protein [Spirochaetaceae bacterium]
MYCCEKCKKDKNIGAQLIGYILFSSNSSTRSWKEDNILGKTDVTQKTNFINGIEPYPFYICKKCYLFYTTSRIIQIPIGLCVSGFLFFLFFSVIKIQDFIIGVCIVIIIICLNYYIIKDLVKFLIKLMRCRNKEEYIKYCIASPRIRSPEFVERLVKGELIDTNEV